MLFEKISFAEFAKHFDSGDEGYVMAKDAYDKIILPHRATPGSAGYDFYLPINVCLTPDRPTVIPTGIRVQIDHGYFLMCVPRSGLGFKYGVRLRNGCGIIDEDYVFADNEGHIMASVTTEVPVSLKAGDRFMQGIFIPYGVTIDDIPIKQARTGGFGSTGGAAS